MNFKRREEKMKIFSLSFFFFSHRKILSFLPPFLSSLETSQQIWEEIYIVLKKKYKKNVNDISTKNKFYIEIEEK